LREAIAALEASGRSDGAAHAGADAASMQTEIAAEHRALGERQADLGRQQAELGRKQHAAADAARQRILRILEEARASGQVQPVK
ncbi:MAG: hypothetical protein ABIT71_18605, partial [Vicinamibacteraceae bacterium]